MTLMIICLLFSTVACAMEDDQRQQQQQQNKIQDIIVTAGPKTIKAWNARTGDLLWYKQPERLLPERGITAFARSGKGNMIAYATPDNTIFFCDLQTGNVVRTMEIPVDDTAKPEKVTALGFDNNDDRLAVAREDTVFVWDFKKDKLINKWAASKDRMFSYRHAWFTGKGRLMLKTSWFLSPPEVELWNVKTGHRTIKYYNIFDEFSQMIKIGFPNKHISFDRIEKKADEHGYYKTDVGYDCITQYEKDKVDITAVKTFFNEKLFTLDHGEFISTIAYCPETEQTGEIPLYNAMDGKQKKD